MRCGISFATCGQYEVRDGGNRRQCLAAKAEGCDRIELVCVPQFASGVTLETKPSILWRHTVTVIADNDAFEPTALQGDVDLRGRRIESVFDQFLGDRCWTLDDFASGDPIDDVRW